jgi:hypothetical protein
MMRNPTLLCLNPIATYMDSNEPYTLTSLLGVHPDHPTGITDHALRRFKDRILPVPRKSARRILESMRQNANLLHGEATYLWQGRQITLYVRNGMVVTVHPWGHTWEG